jgi:DMSO reductase anchor subunit
MPLTPVLFLLYAVSGGALVAGELRIAGFLIAILTLVQIAAWAIGDGRFTGSGTDKGTATGLGSLGKVRVFESAHTSRNYIMDEMVHIVGRKHSMKLRIIAALTIGLIPVVILLLLPAGHLMSLVALVIHLVGVFASRWLFFAEAEHVVGLYYSRG